MRLYLSLCYESISEHCDLTSFPTRRSSDLVGLGTGNNSTRAWLYEVSGNYFDVLKLQPYLGGFFHSSDEHGAGSAPYIDRKSTRLNSSHLGISYAVFCLKKKNKSYYIYIIK